MEALLVHLLPDGGPSLILIVKGKTNLPLPFGESVLAEIPSAAFQSPCTVELYEQPNSNRCAANSQQFAWPSWKALNWGARPFDALFFDKVWILFSIARPLFSCQNAAAEFCLVLGAK